MDRSGQSPGGGDGSSADRGNMRRPASCSETGGGSDLDSATDFELPDHQGRPWRLGEKLAGGPVLLVFYRGDW